MQNPTLPTVKLLEDTHRSVALRQPTLPAGADGAKQPIRVLAVRISSLMCALADDVIAFEGRSPN